jgi:hypothetical protein
MVERGSFQIPESNTSREQRAGKKSIRLLKARESKRRRYELTIRGEGEGGGGQESLDKREGESHYTYI